MLDYLRLCRFPNVFTAVADVWAGFLLMRAGVDDSNWGILLGLTLASACLYMAGMVLNDVFDLEVDREERPFRPLPSGRIPLRNAQLLGFGLLIAGVVFAWQAPRWGSPLPTQPLACPVVGLLLAGAVMGYDSWLKKTPLGPLAMGACRGLNLLLGMVAVAPLGGNGPWLGLPKIYYLLPLGATLYITGLTWFARDEVGQSRRSVLTAAIAVMAAGLLTIGLFPLVETSRLRIDPAMFWSLLVLVIGASILRPFFRAWQDPSPTLVQAAIKHGIMSLITLDALIAFYGVDNPLFAVAVIALILPARLLGYWVYST
ncbi:MAG: UbiA family prenyltransferase [Planctomycetales bacterium]|nr:UbiA family prenyltransferase [Planctomycetales bacterium]